MRRVVNSFLRLVSRPTLEALTERQPCRPHRGGDARRRAPL